MTKKDNAYEIIMGLAGQTTQRQGFKQMKIGALLDETNRQLLIQHFAFKFHAQLNRHDLPLLTVHQLGQIADNPGKMVIPAEEMWQIAKDVDQSCKQAIEEGRAQAQEVFNQIEGSVQNDPLVVVLLNEDGLIRDMYSTALCEKGYIVKTFSHIEPALGCLQMHKIDLFVMPVMIEPGPFNPELTSFGLKTGFVLFDHVKRKHPNQLIVVMSRQGDLDIDSKFKEHNLTYIPDTDPDEFASMCAELLTARVN